MTADSSRTNMADARGDGVAVAKSATPMVELQVAAATAAAERVTAAAVAQPKGGERDDHLETVGRSDAGRTAAASPNNTDFLVAVLMARSDVKSVSDLSRKTIAIDDRYSASSGTVRIAIVAAGAPEVQLSEGKTTAINRLTNGEVPAAVVALVSPDAAETFPQIAGFKIFHVPLSPKPVRAQP